jgi:hypothetical protein
MYSSNRWVASPPHGSRKNQIGPTLRYVPLDHALG